MADTWGLSVFSDGFFQLMVIFSDYPEVTLIKRNPQRTEPADGGKRVPVSAVSDTNETKLK